MCLGGRAGEPLSASRIWVVLLYLAGTVPFWAGKPEQWVRCCLLGPCLISNWVRNAASRVGPWLRVMCDSAGREASRSPGLLAPQQGSTCSRMPGSAPSTMELPQGSTALLHDSLWLVPGGRGGTVLGAPGQAMAGAHQSLKPMLVPGAVPLTEQRGRTVALLLPDGQLPLCNLYLAET